MAITTRLSSTSGSQLQKCWRFDSQSGRAGQHPTPTHSTAIQMAAQNRKEDFGNVWVKARHLSGIISLIANIGYRISGDGTLSARRKTRPLNTPPPLPQTDATETALSEFTALDANANATIPGEITVTGATSYHEQTVSQQFRRPRCRRRSWNRVDGVLPGYNHEGFP